MHEEFNFIQCVMKKKRMKMYYDQVLKEETPLCDSEASEPGMASTSWWLSCKMIRFSGSRNNTMSSTWDGMIITKALSNN
jgi:hypothetical protein